MRTSHLAVSLSSLLLLAAAGCAGHSDAGTSPAAPPATAAAQIERGKEVFTHSCAKCHGSSGQGTEKAPPVVGSDALPLDPPATRKFRKSQFRTALDVAQFVVPNMPPSPAPKLSEADAWAVLAFDLTANGVKLEQPVGPDNAASIKLH